MLLLFLMIALCTSAAPNSPPITIDSKGISPAADSDNTRTVLSLIWSCLSIVFSCTWVAIHPNIPAPQDSDWSIFKRKIGLCLLAVIAPECIILWAMRQHVMARNFRDEYNRTFAMGTGSKWTLTHGFFMGMGGFAYQDENGKMHFPIIPRKSFNYNSRTIPSIDLIHFDLTNISNTHNTILESQIRDRNKGDGLTKSIILIQLAWFATQVVARAVEKFPITPLEIATTAYVLISMVLYGIWWYKPKDVRHPVGVKLSNSHANCSEKYNRQPISAPVHTSFADVSRHLVNGTEYMGVDVTMLRRLPTFFSGNLSCFSNNACFRTELFLGSIFGAIHCAAWSFSFASRIEPFIWRMSCVVVTSVPLLLLLSFEIARRVGHGLLKPVSEYVVGILFYTGFPAYVIGRLLLLAVTFSSLRSMPDGALRVIEWTTFIPHIG